MDGDQAPDSNLRQWQQLAFVHHAEILIASRSDQVDASDS
jgi:hypothetical protein